jgi:dGTPase
VEIRQFTEERERVWLSPYAAKSASSRGRQRLEEECTVRTAWQRDRDRILHSKAFRRLRDKTQVFIRPEGDHYRTRLTHTLEVAQIARTIARGLQLNEDLTEAIALGHDLGHTPFGHAGEQALDRLLGEGFRHNEQSLRVVDHLEKEQGLNLTLEVRDGILCHSGPRLPVTLEGAVVRLSDRIAYINHDLDDAMRARLPQMELLPKHCLDILGHTHSQRIHCMVLDVIVNSRGKDQIVMSPPVATAMDELRDWLFAHVYIGSEAKRDENKAVQMIEMLFHRFCQQVHLLPAPYQRIYQQSGVERAVADYIAGMTDRFIISQFEQMFIPAAWNSENRQEKAF